MELRCLRWLEGFDVGNVEVGAEREALTVGVGGIGDGEDEGFGGDEGHFGVDDVIAFAAAHDDAEGIEGFAVADFSECVGGHQITVYRGSLKCGVLGKQMTFLGLGRENAKVGYGDGK